jgi:hypothetical protein
VEPWSLRIVFRPTHKGAYGLKVAFRSDSQDASFQGGLVFPSDAEPTLKTAQACHAGA